MQISLDKVASGGKRKGRADSNAKRRNLNETHAQTIHFLPYQAFPKVNQPPSPSGDLFFGGVFL
jgi:hypothetical protein